MDDLSALFSTASCAGRIADYILVSCTEWVKWTDIIQHLQLDYLTQTSLEAALKSNSFPRFSYLERKEESFISLKDVTGDERDVQRGVTLWRVQLAHHMSKHSKDSMELGRLASNCPRPSIVPPRIKIKDILCSDGLERFEVFGPASRMMVVLRDSVEFSEKTVSDEKNRDLIEDAKEAWRREIEIHMLADTSEWLMSTVGVNIPRPALLRDGSIKLIDVLREDPQHRFRFVLNKIGATVVRLALSDEELQELLEQWRRDIAHFLADKKVVTSLTEIGTGVKRPSIYLPSAVTLKDAMVEDPSGRFVLSGPMDNVRARLSRDYTKLNSSSISNSNSSSSAPTTGDSKSRNSSGFTTGTGSSSPGTKGGGEYKDWAQVVKTPEGGGLRLSVDDGDVESDRAYNKHRSEGRGKDRNNGQVTLCVRNVPLGATLAGISPFFTTACEGLVAMRMVRSRSGAARGIVEVAFPFTLQGVQSLLRALKKLDMCEYGGLTLYAEVVQDSIPDEDGPEACAPPTALSYMKSAASTPHTPNPYGAHPPIHVSRLTSLFQAQAPEAIMAYATPAEAYSGAEAEVSAGVGAGAGAETGAGTGIGAGAGAGAGVGTDDQLTTPLQEWLPQVLVGLQPDKVQAMLLSLDEEGFLTVGDLVLASQMQQLSKQFLADFGFKTGHVNRLLAKLASLQAQLPSP